MAKRKPRAPVSKSQLLAAIEATYDDSRFAVWIGTGPDCNFYQHLSRFNSSYMEKSDLLKLIQEQSREVIPAMTERDDKLVLSERCALWRQSVNQNQIFHTNAPEHYIHLTCKYEPHFEVYYFIDKSNQTLSFLLGDKEKTLVIEEYTGYVWKPLKTRILCTTIESLERSFQDKFWNPVPIQIGWRVLGIKEAV